MSVVIALGSSSGNQGARIAAPTTRTSQPIDSHAAKPRPLRLRRRTSGPVCTASMAMVPASTGVPRTASPTSPGAGSLSGPGTTDPRVEHHVERVDGEVDEHVSDGDDRDVALQLH